MKHSKKTEYTYPHEYIAFRQNTNGDLPGSETSFKINAAGLAVAFAIIICLKYCGIIWSGLTVLGVFAAAAVISIWGLEFIFRGRKNLFAKIKMRREISPLRIGYKLFGLMLIWCLIAFFYWLLPVYSDSLFKPYFLVLKSGWWLLVILAVAYFTFMDMIEENAENAYWQLGQWLTGYKENANRADIVELLRGWGVKFFYLALMLPYFLQHLNWFMSADFGLMFSTPYQTFYFSNQLIFMVDLAFASIGYMMTLRIFNTQIRSSEPTLVGWMVALACYWPFWGVLILKYFLQYGTGVTWVNVFENTGIWFILWMSLILFCELVYCLATVAMGLRFSNLTYRGLVTGGPYRFSKHPAYVFKNISWWLISMPFMVWAKDPELAVRGSLLLLGVNLLYYLRAKTEENHLSHYPEYVEYALKMNEKSIFAFMGKILPFLKYKAPKS